MLTKTRAIVLRSVKYGDSKLIVDMLTEVHGRVSFAVNIGRGARSRSRKLYFQPLSLLDIEFDKRDMSELQKLVSVAFYRPFVSLQTEAAK